MDAVYQRAMARREALKREISEIDMFLSLYEKYSAETDRKHSEPPQPAHPAFTRRPKRKVRPSELVDIIERLIRMRSAPMQRGEIVDALAESDIELESQDPARYLGTILWRNGDRFVNVPGEGYTLTDLITPIQKSKIADAKAESEELSDEAASEIMAIAELAAEKMRGEELQRVIPFGTGGSLPPEIDSRILAIARDALGRKLDEMEKRMLREQFRRILN
ncbi:MAG: hypothetical protein ACK4PN_07900 [Allorhizobium sp.]